MNIILLLPYLKFTNDILKKLQWNGSEKSLTDKQKNNT